MRPTDVGALRGAPPRPSSHGAAASRTSRWTAVAALAIAASFAVAVPASASPTSDEAARSVLVLPLRTIEVAPDIGALVTSLVVERMSAEPSLSVVAADELKRLVELEGERQGLGCDTDSCLGEIAGAMGARFVVFGDLGRLGSTYLLNLRAYDSTTATVIAREHVEAPTLDALRPALARALDRLAASLSTGAPAAVEAPRGGSPVSSALIWSGAASAALGAAVGVGAGGAAAYLSLALDDPEADGGTRGLARDVGPGVVVVAGLGALAALVGGGALAAGMLLE